MNGTPSPAEWARESGWVSRVRAERAARRLLDLADAIEGALGSDEEDNAGWPDSLRATAKYLAPKVRL